MASGGDEPAGDEVVAAAADGEVDDILATLESGCANTGVTCDPFLLGWYHQKLSPTFHLPHSEDTLAVLLTSTPSMFEHLFLPYLSSPHYSHTHLDPLDQCLKHFFSRLTSLFPSRGVEAIHDFEMCPATRRPRVLVQTAGHVAGVAYYYRREDVHPPDPWPQDTKMYGVSMHPKYGGWFAFRGVLIFPGVRAPGLPCPQPQDCVPTREMRVELLEKFNWSWRDWGYRDVMVGGGPKETYSEQQRQYFSTEPSGRLPLIRHLCSPSAHNPVCDLPPPDHHHS